MTKKFIHDKEMLVWSIIFSTLAAIAGVIVLVTDLTVVEGPAKIIACVYMSLAIGTLISSTYQRHPYE